MSSHIVLSSFKTWFRVRGGLSGPLVFLLIMFFVEGAFWRALSGPSGAVGGYAFGRVAANYFENVRLPGALPMLDAAAVLVSAAILASLIPAARASRVDVLQALRSE